MLKITLIQRIVCSESKIIFHFQSKVRPMIRIMNKIKSLNLKISTLLKFSYLQRICENSPCSFYKSFIINYCAGSSAPFRSVYENNDFKLASVSLR